VGLELGAEEAKIIDTETVVVSEWVRWKCLYGCPLYAKDPFHLPVAPDAESTKQVLREYTRAILLNGPEIANLKPLNRRDSSLGPEGPLRKRTVWQQCGRPLLLMLFSRWLCRGGGGRGQERKGHPPADLLLYLAVLLDEVLDEPVSQDQQLPDAAPVGEGRREIILLQKPEVMIIYELVP
jgi:Predicted metal-binding protein (DUF2284)